MQAATRARPAAPTAAAQAQVRSPAKRLLASAQSGDTQLPRKSDAPGVTDRLRARLQPSSSDIGVTKARAYAAAVEAAEGCREDWRNELQTLQRSPWAVPLTEVRARATPSELPRLNRFLSQLDSGRHLKLPSGEWTGGASLVAQLYGRVEEAERERMAHWRDPVRAAHQMIPQDLWKVARALFSQAVERGDLVHRAAENGLTHGEGANRHLGIEVRNRLWEDFAARIKTLNADVYRRARDEAYASFDTQSVAREGTAPSFDQVNSTLKQVLDKEFPPADGKGAPQAGTTSASPARPVAQPSPPRPLPEAFGLRSPPSVGVATHESAKVGPYATWLKETQQRLQTLSGAKAPAEVSRRMGGDSAALPKIKTLLFTDADHLKQSEIPQLQAGFEALLDVLPRKWSTTEQSRAPDAKSATTASPRPAAPSASLAPQMPDGDGEEESPARLFPLPTGLPRKPE